MQASSLLTMHYRSVPTAYYATGAWTSGSSKDESLYAVDYTETTEGRLTFRNSAKLAANCNLTFFRYRPECQSEEHQTRPSLEKENYWQQAVVPKSLYNRFTQITNNSGKFLVFIPFEKLDDAWDKFKAAYEQGRLGYGLQCATAKPNPNAADYYVKVILVHTENAFDLDEIARVAWEINGVLDEVLDGSRRRFRYLTDRSTKALCGFGSNESNALYSFDSRFFISREGQRKNLQTYSYHFKQNCSDAAQQRQDSLKGKNWRKFIPEIS